MPEFKINKKVKLIELFAGVGSQAMALRDSGIDFDYHKICEWEVNAIASYRAIHMSDDKNDYSVRYTRKNLVEILHNAGISSDGKKPMSIESINRKPEKWIRKTYNNIQATHNLVDITSAHADDLEIIDREKYCYIITYSFPCQDLSKAGKQKGMAKGSGTRSSMLWEVERILGELWKKKQLPHVLLMENVPDVIGMKNIACFNQWYAKLESIGYQSYYKILNAKDFGIPQNRERCFMISILGDYNYAWPQPIPLEKRLKDMLEPIVDEKYYISEDKIKAMQTTSYESSKYDNVVQKQEGICHTLCARDYKDPKCVVVGETNYSSFESANRIFDPGGLCPTLNTMGGGNLEPKIVDPVICASRGRNPDNPKSRKSGELTEQMLEINISGCSNTLTTVQKDNYVMEPICLNSKVNGKQPSVQDRIYDPEAISTSITTSFMPNVAEPSGIYTNCSKRFDRGCLKGVSRCLKACNHDAGFTDSIRIRKLTPLECWRLMGFNDDDFYKASKVNSNSQLYKQAGNSIVKNVLMNIFKMLF